MVAISQETANNLFSLGSDLAEELLEKVKGVKLPIKDLDEALYKGALIFFFCKVYKSYQAVRLLWGKGFAQDAYVLTRTIFELAIQAQYMNAAPEKRARRFVEHDSVVRYRHCEDLKRLGDEELTQGI